jgi:MYXO-CTERM domain-containing protein
MKKILLLNVVFCAMVFGTVLAESMSLDFSSEGYAATGLGNKQWLGTKEFDKLNVLDMSGTINLETGQTGKFLINNFTFQSGWTGLFSHNKNYLYGTSRAFTINGVTHDLEQDFRLHVGNSRSGDTLKFLGGEAVEFASDTMTVTVTPFVSNTVKSKGGIVTGSLYAKFTLQQTAATPEPSSLAMAAVGILALAGYGLRRREPVAA